MLAQKSLGRIEIILGILLLFATGYANLLFFSPPDAYYDDLYSATKPYEEIASQAEAISKDYAEEVRRVSYDKSSFPILHLNAATNHLAVEWQLSNLARLIVIGFDFVVIAQALMFIMWGLQKFSKEQRK